MIQLQAAAICDAATVREGLLHILGAGITVFNRPSFPAPFSAHIGILLTAWDVPDVGEQHAVHVIARHVDTPTARVFEADIEMKVDRALDGSRIQTLPIALDLSNAGLPAVGFYELSLEIDGDQVSLSLFEARVDANLPQLPPTPFG